MILTKPQVAALTRAQGAANEVMPMLAFLETMAGVYPPIRERVAELRALRDLLLTTAETALEADRMASYGAFNDQ